MWILIFKWCVVRCGSKNRYSKKSCPQNICAQNMLIILDTIVISIDCGDPFDHSISTIIFTLLMSMSSRNYEENGYGRDLDLLNHLTLVACFISYKT